MEDNTHVAVVNGFGEQAEAGLPGGGVIDPATIRVGIVLATLSCVIVLGSTGLVATPLLVTTLLATGLGYSSVV